MFGWNEWTTDEKMFSSFLKNDKKVDREKTEDYDELEEVLKSAGPDKLRNLPREPPTRCTLDGEMLLAQSMTALSINERDRIMEDIHGVVVDKVASPASTPTFRVVSPTLPCVSDSSLPHLVEGTTYMSKMTQQQPTDPAAKAGNTAIDDDISQHLLQHEIEKVPNKYAYDAAYATSSTYVTDKDFLKLFLEADLYNYKHAAVRIVSYFEFKLELFGPSKLARDITQNDLTREELEVLYSGRFHRLCNLRDTAGRFIIFARASRDPTDVLLRIGWYMFHRLLLGDSSTREKGLVVIIYNNHHPTYYNYDVYREPPKEHTWRLFKVFQSIPIKFAAGHFCYGDMSPPVRALLNLSISTLESKHMNRAKLHFGSHMEIVHGLMSFGIAPAAIPIPFEGYSHEALPLEHQNFLKLQKRIEDGVEHRQSNTGLPSQKQANPAESNGELEYMQLLPQEEQNCQIQRAPRERAPHAQDQYSGVESNIPVSKESQERVAIPGPYDIVLGKGRPLGRHQGNVYFRQVIAHYGEQYDNCNRRDKTLLAIKLVEIIHASGVRFLKQTDSPGKGWYVEVSDDVARQKVSHTFRNRRMIQNQNNEKSIGRTPFGANGEQMAARYTASRRVVNNGSPSFLSVNANNDNACGMQCDYFCMG